MERYTLHAQGKIVAEGRAIGHRIGAGPVKVIHDISEMNRIEPGDVLVTDMTDPDWEPIMKKAAAIVTNRRPYLPCGDHRPRTGYSCGCRLR
jgi:pyruvate,water dikinase